MNNGVKVILEGFTKSYVKKTKEPSDFSFGFKVDNNWYYIFIQKDGEFEVIKEEPPKDKLYFTTDSETLKKIYNGKMAIMTAMGRARWDDPTPLDIKNLEDFPQDINPYAFVFKYFTIGQPEKIKLKNEYARIIHGGYAIPIVYDEGLRTGWYRIEEGMIINEEESQQTNPFPTLIIAIEGTGTAKIGDKEYTLEKGDAYHISSNIPHMFWTNDKNGFEFIIIMYGENA